MADNLRKLLLGIFWSSALASQLAAQELPVVTMQYYERKPFHYTSETGKVVGLVVAPTEQAFAKIGIPVKWQLVPANRILDTLKRDESPLCSPGWYKNPERMEYAQFSEPIYRDKPLVGLGNADFPVKQGITAKELFARPETRLLIKQNFSQGAYMDKIIAGMPTAQVQAVPVDVTNLVQMIHARRADLIVTTQEEVEIYVEQAALKLKDFRVLVFPDVPAVEKRYILCSKSVPASLMAKLNKAIGTKPL
ncbi:substrate-binding periplasmic protein [Rhodoferax saidenbachensis]|nr:transporter substrate-binding domain-containing protein [Rhodoferax saidenbachensis]